MSQRNIVPLSLEPQSTGMWPTCGQSQTPGLASVENWKLTVQRSKSWQQHVSSHCEQVVQDWFFNILNNPRSHMISFQSAVLWLSLPRFNSLTIKPKVYWKDPSTHTEDKQMVVLSPGLLSIRGCKTKVVGGQFHHTVRGNSPRKKAVTAKM